MAKAKSKYTSHKEAAMTRIMAKLAAGVDRGLDFITAEAIQHAPVGKHRKQGKGLRQRREVAVEAIHTNILTTKRRYETIVTGITSGKKLNLTTVRRKASYPASSLRKYREGVSDFGEGGEGSDAAKYAVLGRQRPVSFQFRFQEKKSGREVSRNIGVSRKGGLKVASGRQGGNLRSKIHRTALELDGRRVSGKVRSDAPYSAPVEFGYAGAGRSRKSKGPGVSFMRPAREAFAANWRDFFKG